MAVRRVADHNTANTWSLAGSAKRTVWASGALSDNTATVWAGMVAAREASASHASPAAARQPYRGEMAIVGRVEILA